MQACSFDSPSFDEVGVLAIGIEISEWQQEPIRPVDVEYLPAGRTEVEDVCKHHRHYINHNYYPGDELMNRISIPWPETDL